MTATPSNTNLEQRIADIEKKLNGDETYEKAIKGMEKKLRYLVEISLDPVVVFNYQGNIDTTNTTFLQMIGCSEKEVIGTPMTKHMIAESGSYESKTGEQLSIDDNYLKKQEGYHRRLQEDGKVCDWEGHFVNKDKKIVPTIRNIVNLGSDDKGNSGFLCVIHELTDSKKADFEIVELKKSFENIFETSLDGIVVTNNRGDITRTNSFFQKLVGYKENELLQMNAKQLAVIEPGSYKSTDGELVEVTKSTIETNSQNISDLVNDGSTVNWETYILRKDKQVIPVEQSIVLLRDEKNEGIGSAAIIRDITNRTQHEQELRESEERFRALAKSAPEAILAVDSNGLISYWNDGAEEIFGYKEEEVLETPYFSLISQRERDEDKDKFFNLQGNDGGFYPRRSIFGYGVRKDGREVAVELSVGDWKTRKGNYYLAIIRDITKRVEMEEQLQKAYGELEIEVKKRTIDLEEVNSALKVLLKKREEDNAALEEKMIFNVNELVIPLLEKLKNTNLEKGQSAYIDVIESSLNEIVSPFLRGLAINHIKLTPAEIQVANLVKLGKITREIAEVLKLRTKTVDFHRKNIRRKLGLRNKKVNLRTFLLSVE